MFGINKRRNTVNASYISQGKAIVKLSELTGKVVRVWGYIITKEGKYGKGVLLCGDDCLISLPKRYTEGFEQGSDEEIAKITSGRCKIYDIKTIPTNQGKDTTVFEMGDDEEYMAFLEAKNTK